MRVIVKLFASLSVYLPADAHRNQVELDFPEGVTPVDIIKQLGVPSSMAHLVIVNGIYVPPSERATRKLVAHEELAIFPPVAGG